MPAPTTVTSEQVTQAAATLAEQGKPITGWTLRGVIGSGRPNRLMAVWREQQDLPAQEEEQPKTDILHSACPPEVRALAEGWSGDIGRFVEGLTRTAWGQAYALANRLYLDQVSTLLARVGELERDLDYASQQVGATEDYTSKLRLEWAKATRDAAHQVEVARQDVAQARAEAEAHRDANVRLQATLDELVRRLPRFEQPEAA